jgi:hypothetical protein
MPLVMIIRTLSVLDYRFLVVSLSYVFFNPGRTFRIRRKLSARKSWPRQCTIFHFSSNRFSGQKLRCVTFVLTMIRDRLLRAHFLRIFPAMSTAPLADLAFLAQVMVDVGRSKEATEHLTQYIAIEPSLDDALRLLFQSVFKRSVDSRRKNIRYFDQCIVNEEGNPATLERLGALRARELAELNALAAQAFALIDEKLLPNAKGPAALIFFQKLRADLARYLCEFATGEALQEAKAAAQSAYAAALAGAERDLRPADPGRLGAVLNCAVFKYEHCQLCQEAAELLEAAIDAASADSADLDEDARQEGREIIAVMRTNLESWGKTKVFEEEEYTDE